VVKVRPMRFETTDTKVATMLPHVRYEIEQCFLISEHREDDWHLRESVFLAILIHARILLTFFESTDRRLDDVLCSDFGFPSSQVSISVQHRNRFNKDMVHLTYSRLRHTTETKPWPVGAILPPLLDRSVGFIKHILSHPPKGADEQELTAWNALFHLLNGSRSTTH